MPKEKAVKKEKPEMLGTKDVADRLKIDPKRLRVILRSIPAQQLGDDKGRYEWKPSDPFLDKLPSIIDKYEQEHKREKKEKTKKAKKAKAKKAKAKKVKQAESEAEAEASESEEAEEVA